MSQIQVDEKVLASLVRMATRGRGTVSQIQVDERVLASLVAGAITDLYYADQDEGCCPECCAPCWALKQLLDAGQLDDAVRPYEDTWSLNAGGRHQWWIDTEPSKPTGHVDRAFLARAWRMTSCHEER